MGTTAELNADLVASRRDVLVGTDEGTHSERAIHRIFERVDGSRYAVRVIGRRASRITEATARDRTAGRIRPVEHVSLSSRRAQVAAIHKAIAALG